MTRTAKVMMAAVLLVALGTVAWPIGQALGLTPSVVPGSSSTPSGAAGGDLGGTYPNPSVLKVNGVVAGTMANQNASAVAITGGSVTGITDLAVADGGTGASTQSGARTGLGLGTIATQNANSVSITGGSVTGITDLAVADGGTGASTQSGARTGLGLGTISTQDANSVAITGGSVTGITDLAVADGGTGASTQAGARTGIGLGTIATQDANNVNITGGSITGVTGITSTTITPAAYASCPGSPSNGDWCIPTNSPVVRYRSGGVWVDYLPPWGQVTVPTVAGFTALNSAVLSDVGGLVIKETILSGTDRIRGAYTTTIAAPYNICAVFDGPGIRENYISLGLFLSDGTKLLGFSFANTCASGAPCLEADRFNSVTSYASTIGFATFGNGGGERTELCISDDGATRKYWASFDGTDFTVLFSIADTDWITTAAAVRTGMYLLSNNATYLGYGRFYTFRQTAGATPAFP